MRYLLILCLLTAGVLLPGGLAAQTFRASLLAGGNFSQIDGDELFGYHQLGLNAGLRVVAVLNERWRVGPEILFSQQGARRNSNSLNVSPFDEFRLNTLEVPLMVYFKDWRLTAEAGLSYQNLFSYEVISSAGEDITAATELRSHLLALKAGVTFFLTPRAGLNFRFSRHLTDVDVDNRLNTSFKGKSISVRFVYTLGQGEALPKPPVTDEN